MLYDADVHKNNRDSSIIACYCHYNECTLGMSTLCVWVQCVDEYIMYISALCFMSKLCRWEHYVCECIGFMHTWEHCVYEYIIVMCTLCFRAAVRSRWARSWGHCWMRWRGWSRDNRKIRRNTGTNGKSIVLINT